MTNIVNFFIISIDLSMKYKQDIQMKIDATWPFLSETMACFFNLLYQLFTNIKIRNVSRQKLSNFLSVVLKNFNFFKVLLLIYGISK